MPQVLERTEQRLRLALESAQAGTWDYDVTTGLVDCDARCRALFGGGPPEPDEKLTYDDFLKCVLPEDRERIDALTRSAMLPESGGDFRADYRLATPNGSTGAERWLQARGRVFFERGRPLRFVGTVIDITEQKRSAALLERAARRAAVVAGAGEVLSASIDYETTLTNIISLCLPALGDFGYFDVVEPEGVRRLVQALADPARQALLSKTRWTRWDRADINLCALSSGEPALHSRIDERWLQRVATSDGHLALLRELRFGSMITVPLRYQGQLLGALTLFHDAPGRQHDREDLETALEVARRASAALTNARLYRDAQEAIRTRDEFLSIASHELRTPLTSAELHVSGLLRYLGQPKETLDVERLRDRLRRTHVQLGRITALIEQLIDVTMMTRSAPMLHPESFDLCALVEEVAGRFEGQVEQSGCELLLQLEGPVYGSWDRGRVDQAVTNLVSNALKYGPGKPVELCVQRLGERATVSVRDHGAGIHPRDHARIFERFERAVSSRNYGGLGLGLWIARQSVELHGGEVTVQSAPGEGSTFVISLPTAQAEQKVG